jgi:predicted nucleic acid-binding protein
MKNIDEKDTPFLALAWQLSCPIWSNDKHFKEQTIAEVYTTKDVAELLRASSIRSCF